MPRATSSVATQRPATPAPTTVTSGVVSRATSDSLQRRVDNRIGGKGHFNLLRPGVFRGGRRSSLLFLHRSLRRHDPDQVSWVSASTRFSALWRGTPTVH